MSFTYAYNFESSLDRLGTLSFTAKKSICSLHTQWCPSNKYQFLLEHLYTIIAFKLTLCITLWDASNLQAGVYFVSCTVPSQKVPLPKGSFDIWLAGKRWLKV